MYIARRIFGPTMSRLQRICSGVHQFSAAPWATSDATLSICGPSAPITIGTRGAVFRTSATYSRTALIGFSVTLPEPMPRMKCASECSHALRPARASTAGGLRTMGTTETPLGRPVR